MAEGTDADQGKGVGWKVMGTLHIYAQEMWHCNAYIAGTREDLEMLRLAIDHALTAGHGETLAFTCDGEGYTVHVVSVTEQQADAMPVPYTDECARAQQDRMQFGPWKLIIYEPEGRSEE